MFGRKGSSPPEDPAVGPVEEIFGRSATYRVPPQSSRPVATKQALWICACVTMDDAPVWLIYEDGDQALVWCRVPDGSDIPDVVDAELIAGGHTDPAGVLEWLEGKATHPWTGGGSGWDGDGVLAQFGRALGRP